MGKILESFHDSAIIVINIHSLISYCSPAILDIFGYTPEELQGKLLTQLMPEKYRVHHLMGMDRYMLTGKKGVDWHSVRLEGLHKDGSLFPVDISFGEYEQDNNAFFLGIARKVYDSGDVRTLKPSDIQDIVHELKAL